MVTKYQYLQVRPDGTYTTETTQAYNRAHEEMYVERLPRFMPKLASVSTILKAIKELGLKQFVIVRWVDSSRNRAVIDPTILPGRNFCYDANGYPTTVFDPSEVLPVIRKFSKENRPENNGLWALELKICGVTFTSTQHEDLEKLISILTK